MTAPVDALQLVLAGEHAAVYVFGVLAAQTSQKGQPQVWQHLDEAWGWHRDARDALVARIEATGATPVAAEPSYRLPNAVATADEVLTAALVTERRVSDVYGTLVAQTVADDRGEAVRSLDESAVRQLLFRGRPEIFPGTGGLGGAAGQAR